MLDGRLRRLRSIAERLGGVKPLGAQPDLPRAGVAQGNRLFHQRELSRIRRRPKPVMTRPRLDPPAAGDIEQVRLIAARFEMHGLAGLELVPLSAQGDDLALAQP